MQILVRLYLVFYSVHLLLHGLELRLLVVRTRHSRRYRWLPVVDVHSVARRLVPPQSRRCIGEAALAHAAATTSHAERIHVVSCVGIVQVLGRRRHTEPRVNADAVPAILHVRDTAGEWLLALARSPVVAGGDPLIDEVFCAGLEEVDRATSKREDKAVRALAVVSWWGQDMRQGVRQVDVAN